MFHVCVRKIDLIGTVWGLIVFVLSPAERAGAHGLSRLDCTGLRRVAADAALPATDGARWGLITPPIPSPSGSLLRPRSSFAHAVVRSRSWKWNWMGRDS